MREDMVRGDFTGFSFDGIHSSRLGITRVSEGDRYNETLLPELENNITPIAGNDGNFYFGSYEREKTIPVSIAFDSMTETQFRKMTQLFKSKKLCPLIFDERPYKVYMVKLSTPPQLNYICFDEQAKAILAPRDGIRVIRGKEIIDGEEVETWAREQIRPYELLDRKERIYKGEGTLEFVCPSGFAHEQFKILEDYTENGSYTNVDEWAAASKILSQSLHDRYMIDQVQLIDVVEGNDENEQSTYNAKIVVYNPGDKDAPFYLYIPFNENGWIEPQYGESIIINYNNKILGLQPIKRKNDSETGIVINTYNHLIEGVIYTGNANTLIGWNITGSLYNEKIVGGDFIQLKPLDWGLEDSLSYTDNLYINCANTENMEIRYNYLYY